MSTVTPARPPLHAPSTPAGNLIRNAEPPKLGFDRYLEQELAKAGGRVSDGRGNKGFAFGSGPYRGMTKGRAIEKIRANYAAMAPDQRAEYEHAAYARDVMSPAEVAREAVGYSARGVMAGGGEDGSRVTSHGSDGGGMTGVSRPGPTATPEAMAAAPSPPPAGTTIGPDGRSMAPTPARGPATPPPTPTPTPSGSSAMPESAGLSDLDRELLAEGLRAGPRAVPRYDPSTPYPGASGFRSSNASPGGGHFALRTEAERQQRIAGSHVSQVRGSSTPTRSVAYNPPEVGRAVPNAAGGRTLTGLPAGSYGYSTPARAIGTATPTPTPTAAPRATTPARSAEEQAAWREAAQESFNRGITAGPRQIGLTAAQKANAAAQGEASRNRAPAYPELPKLAGVKRTPPSMTRSI